MAISETVLKDTVLMAIDEINAKGGVMGKIDALTERVQVVERQAQARGAAGDLRQALLAGDVQRRQARAHRGEGLQQQRRLADAGITAQQHQGTRHQTTAEHTIQLAVAAAQALQGPIAHSRNGLGAPGCRGHRRLRCRGHRAAAAVVGWGGCLLHQRVPTAAAAAAAKELPGLGSAALADVKAGGAGQNGV